METEFALSLGTQRWALPAGSDTITIGRASNADVRLQADDQISRIHARLSRTGTTWTLHDESRNGTGLNGRRLAAPTPLTEGDRIHIGRSVLTFHEPPTAPDATAPPASSASSAPVPAPAGPPASTPAPPVSPAPPPAGQYPPGEHPEPADGSAPSTPADARSQFEPDEPGPSRYAPPAPDPASARPAESSPFAPDPAGQYASHEHPEPPNRNAPSTPADAARPAEANPFAPDPAGQYASHEHPEPANRNAPSTPAETARSQFEADEPDEPGPGRYAPPAADTARAAEGNPFAPGPQGQYASPGPHPPARASDPASARPAEGNPFAPDQPGQYASREHTESASAPDSVGQYASREHREPAEGGAGSTPAEAGSRPFAAGEREQGPFAPDERVENPFAPGERDQSRSASAESEAPDMPGAPPAPEDNERPRADIPRGTDAPSNFPFFLGEPYTAADQPPYAAAGEPDRQADDAWAAYPSADNPEPARSPWENPPTPQLDQSQLNWNESASWPDTRPGDKPNRRLRSANRTAGDRNRNQNRDQAGDRDGNAARGRGRDRTGDRPGPGDRAVASSTAGASDRAGARDRTVAGDSDDEVGTVRLLRVLLVAAFIVVLGLLINLTITFLADGPGGALRWLIPPAIALVVAMIVALLDAAAPTNRAPSRLDVSIIIAIVVVLLGVGVGGFALTAGAEYVGGYLTGNESGEDRLIKPAAKAAGGLTVTVENVTYTSHFTRVEVKLTNTGRKPVSLPLTSAASLAADDGTALHADTSRSQWPGSIPTGGSADGSITFKGHLPDATTSATLTIESADTAIDLDLTN